MCCSSCRGGGVRASVVAETAVGSAIESATRATHLMSVGSLYVYLQRALAAQATQR